MEEKATVEMIVASFQDHWAFNDIAVPHTLTRELMFDRVFLVGGDDSVSIDVEVADNRASAGQPEILVDVPTLMLLGILYCRSTRKQRA